MRFPLFSGVAVVFTVVLFACQPGSGDLGFGGSAGSGGMGGMAPEPPCLLDACSGERCSNDGDCLLVPGTFCGACSDDNFKHCLVLRMKDACCTRDRECVTGLCSEDADAGTAGTCTGPAGR